MLYSKIDPTNYRKALDINVVNETLMKLRKAKKSGGKESKNCTLRGYISTVKHFVEFHQGDARSGPCFHSFKVGYPRSKIKQYIYGPKKRGSNEKL